MNDKNIEKHSVNCYFCGIEFDEREGTNADDFNDNDGGSCCPECLKRFQAFKEQWSFSNSELKETFGEKD